MNCPYKLCDDRDRDSLCCSFFYRFCREYKRFKFEERQLKESDLEHLENERIRLLRLAGRDGEII